MFKTNVVRCAVDKKDFLKVHSGSFMAVRQVGEEVQLDKEGVKQLRDICDKFLGNGDE